MTDMTVEPSNGTVPNNESGGLACLIGQTK